MLKSSSLTILLIWLLTIFKLFSVEASERNSSDRSTSRLYSLTSAGTFNSSGTVDLFISNDNELLGDLPDFLTKRMTHRDIYIAAYDLIQENFDFMIIGLYLKGYHSTDLMNFIFIVNGMLCSENTVILQTLLSLWGYYLTLQDGFSEAALRDLMELIDNERYFTRLSDLFGLLLDTCKSLSILTLEHKIILREILELQSDFKLSLQGLKYLYEIDSETLEFILTMKMTYKPVHYVIPSRFYVGLFGQLFKQYNRNK